MRDTPKNVEKIYANLLSKKTSAERLKMGCSMFDLACAVIKSSFPKNLSDVEKKQRLFLRLYSSDLEESLKKRVLNKIQTNQ